MGRRPSEVFVVEAVRSRVGRRDGARGWTIGRRRRPVPVVAGV